MVKEGGWEILGTEKRESQAKATLMAGSWKLCAHISAGRFMKVLSSQV